MTSSLSSRSVLIQSAAYLSVVVATSIVIMKFYAWHATGSLSLLSSLVDSLLDVMASTINLLAVKYALKPADEDHRFGHGKAEDLAAMAQSLFVAASALFVIIRAIQRYIHPTDIEQPGYGIIVMAISTLLSFLLVSYQYVVVKKTGSNVIKADALHYQVDLLVNVIVIISLATTTYFNKGAIDVTIALLIAVYIFKGAWQIGKKAFDNLMDKEFSDEDRESIVKAAMAHPSVLGVHDLRTRYSGHKPFIQFHLELSGGLTLMEAHRISDEVEKAIVRAFPHAEVLVHQDPVVDKKKSL